MRTRLSPVPVLMLVFALVFALVLPLVLPLAPVLAPPHARAAPRKIEVVATLGVLAGLAREVGGDRVHATALIKPNQDPHTLVAKPTFKLAARNAQLFVELGLGLDAWATAVTDASGNPGIQSGQNGRVVASDGIATRELPSTLSKAWGDVHPSGNPHVWLDPVNAKQIAANIAAGLSRVDPEGKAIYEQNLRAFRARIDEALYGRALLAEYGASKLERLSRRGELIDYLKARSTYDKLGGWLARAEPLRGLEIITYHKTWVYFCDRFGIEIRGEIEEKPGIPPSQDYLAALIEKVRAEGIRVIFIDPIYPTKEGAYIAEKTGAKIVSSPIDLGGAPGTDDYFGLIGTLIDRVLAAAKA